MDFFTHHSIIPGIIGLVVGLVAGFYLDFPRLSDINKKAEADYQQWKRENQGASKPVLKSIKGGKVS